VEVEHLLVPRRDCLHLAVTLIAHTVVDESETRDWQDCVNDLGQMVFAEAREEGAIVINALNECVDGVAIGLNRSHNDRSILVAILLRLGDTGGTTLYCLVVNASRVIDGESHVADTITVLGKVGADLSHVRIERGSKGVHDVVVAHNVSHKVA